MRVELTGRHVEISPGLRRLVERKIQKVQRIVNDAGVSAAVVVTKEKINNVVELSLHARGEQFTPRPARTAAARGAASVTGPPPATEGAKRRVVRAHRYSVKPMTIDQAATELEGQKAPFLVFRDITTDAVSVVYRRDDGQIALIEPEA